MHFQNKTTHKSRIVKMLFQIYFIDWFSFVIELNCYLNWLDISKNNKIRLQDSFSFIFKSIKIDIYSLCIYSEIKIYHYNEKLAFFVNRFKKRAEKRQILAQKGKKKNKKWLNCKNNVLTEKGRIKSKKDQICILKFWLDIK